MVIRNGHHFLFYVIFINMIYRKIVKRVLNEIIDEKENPTMKIEISGHTDTRGTAQDNQTLSENRAKSVVDYLISHGIDSKRLEYKGYGESTPLIPDSEINKMKTNSEKEDAHQQNRRTEFKVLSM